MATTWDKHAQILDAAVSEFQERGFAGASMDRIAARAKVSKRTVYNHFDGKEALFQAILEVMAEQVNAALEVAYDPARPIEPQLVELGRAEGRLLTSAPFMRLARMAFGETVRDPALAKEMTERMEKISVFRDFFKAAHAAGAITASDPELASAQFTGLIKSQAFWPAVFTGQEVGNEEMEKIIQTSVEMFLRSYASVGKK